MSNMEFITKRNLPWHWVSFFPSPLKLWKYCRHCQTCQMLSACVLALFELTFSPRKNYRNVLFWLYFLQWTTQLYYKNRTALFQTARLFQRPGKAYAKGRQVAPGDFQGSDQLKSAADQNIVTGRTITGKPGIDKGAKIHSVKI